MAGNPFSILDPTALVNARLEGERLQERLQNSSALAERLENGSASFKEILLNKELGIQDPSLSLLNVLKQADDERWEREHGSGSTSSFDSIFPDFIGKSSYLTNPSIVKFLAQNEEAGGVDSTLNLFDSNDNNLPSLAKILSGRADDTRTQIEKTIVGEASKALGEDSSIDDAFLQENIFLAGLIAKHKTVASYFRGNPQAAEQIIAETSRFPELAGDDLSLFPDLSSFSF